MKVARISLASILALQLFFSAHAQDADTASDVRCLLVGVQMSRSIDITQQSSGMMVAMYYFGRLDRAVLAPNLERLIASTAAQMSAADLQAEAARCGKSLVEKGKLLQRIGSNLTLQSAKP